MRLIRFGNAGQERPGLVDDNGVWRDGDVLHLTIDGLGEQQSTVRQHG